MKKTIFLLTFLCACLASNAQEYWLCKVKSSVNMRKCASTECDVICTIPAGSYVVASFPTLLLDDKQFIKTHYVNKNISGYVAANFLTKEQIIEIDKSGVFQRTGTSTGYDPQLQIYNKTEKKITVRINGTGYDFRPYENRTITCAPGKMTIMASSPGVIPYIGEDRVESNGIYTWEFFIRREYR